MTLKDCPFCGNQNMARDEGCFPVGQRWEVRCGNPDCFAHEPSAETREEAIGKWNNRRLKAE